MSHTPGPWTTDGIARDRSVDGYNTTGISVSKEGVARAIALVYAGFGDGEQIARLIAAAPDLLEALKKVSKRLEHVLSQQGITASPSDLREAQAAIAKAEGK